MKVTLRRKEAVLALQEYILDKYGIQNIADKELSSEISDYSGDYFTMSIEDKEIEIDI